MSDLEGRSKPSTIESDVYDKDIVALRYSEIPSNQQMRVDFDTRTDGQAVYMGWAARGLSESDTGWLLHYLEYDGNNAFIKRTIAIDSWDNRKTSASYA